MSLSHIALIQAALSVCGFFFVVFFLFLGGWGSEGGVNAIPQRNGNNKVFISSGGFSLGKTVWRQRGKLIAPAVREKKGYFNNGL